MLKYVLEPEDIEDENLLSHWTDVLFHLHNIRQKFPRPTASFLEIDNEVFNKKVMRVDNNCLRIDSNPKAYDKITDLTRSNDELRKNANKSNSGA